MLELNAVAIGKRLAKLRRGRKVEKISNDLGISMSALRMYESGHRIPCDENKIRLAEYYKTSVQKIFFSPDVIIRGNNANNNDI